MQNTMQAMVYHNYGSLDMLRLQEMEVPAVQADQALVKVYAVPINALDWRSLTGSPFLARIMAGGLLKPKQQVLGVDLAGRVDAVGAAVTRFQPGERISPKTVSAIT